MNEQVSAFFKSLQRKPNVVSGHVVAVTADTTTGEQRSATVAIGGNTISVPLDALAPRLAMGDQVRLEQYGQAALAEYRLAGLEAGARPGSGFYTVLDNGTVIGGTAYPGGDLLLGSRQDGISWWYQAAAGRWLIRHGTTMQGAIGNLADIYDYLSEEYGTAFGEFAAGQAWLAMDPTSGFRIMLYDKRAFQAHPTGVTSFGIEDETEIEIDPVAQTIAFKIGGQVVSYVGTSGALHVDMHRQFQFVAEFSGAILDAQGGANVGTLTGRHDATNHRNYYNWTTSEGTTQNYDVVLQIKLPPEFYYLDPLGVDNPWVYLITRVSDAPGATAVRLVEFLDDDGVNCITPSSSQNTSWGMDSYQIAGGTFAPGDTLTLRIRLLADPGKHAMLHAVLLNWVAREQ